MITLLSNAQAPLIISLAPVGRTARAQTVVDKQAAISRSKDLYFHQHFKAKLPYLESCQAVRGGKEWWEMKGGALKMHAHVSFPMY